MSLTTRVGDVEWHSLSGGRTTAPPIVLVHGLSISSAYMRPIAEILALDHRVLAPDLPGFGKSDKPQGTLCVSDSAHALKEWLQAIGIQRATFAANSFGCDVIVALAARYPHLVDRLILIGPSVGANASAVDMAKRLAKDGVMERPKLLLLHLRDDIRAGVGRIWRTAKLALAHDITKEARTVQAPTLILRGANDPLVSTREAKLLTRRMPNAKFQLIADAAHAAHYSAPEAVARAIRDFVRAKAGPQTS